MRVVLQVGVERHHQFARARAKPALSAAALPKLRRKRMPRTRGSAAASDLITSHDASVEPSSTKMISIS